jgi:predicted AlkP superfamily phosphohydrolase/phosphomutase
MDPDAGGHPTKSERLTRTARELGVVLLTAALVAVVLTACSDSSEPRPKVLVLGIDAMGWKVLDPLISQDRVPHFADLVANGASGVLGTNPGCSPRYWTTIATGKVPAKHQLWGWTVFDKAAGRRPMRSTDRRCKAVWNIAGEHDRTAAVVNYLATWPAEEINGWMVPSYFYHGLENRQRSTTPAALADEISHLKIPAFIVDKPTRHSDEEIIANANDEAVWVAAVGRHILEEHDPDLLMLYTLGIDWLGHRFWAYYQPEHYQEPPWTVDPDQVERYGNVIPELYSATDRELGTVIDSLDENTTVIVLSDHAMKAWNEGRDVNTAIIDFDRILQRTGHLTTDASGKPDRDRSLAFSIDQGPWEDELAYIAVNLEAGNPRFATVLEELVKIFEGIVWATDGQPVFNKVLTRSETGSGFPYSTDDFDLVVVEREPWPYRAPYAERADEEILIQGEPVVLRDLLSFAGPGKPGIHDLDDGVIIMAGKNIRRGVRLDGAHLLDIAPTLLHLLGLPVARDMDGQVLVDALEPAFLRRNPIRFVDTYEDTSTPSATPTTEDALPEEEVLQERLRSLGYLD